MKRRLGFYQADIQDVAAHVEGSAAIVKQASVMHKGPLPTAPAPKPRPPGAAIVTGGGGGGGGKVASLEAEIKRLKTHALRQAKGGDKGAARVTMAKYKALEQQLAAAEPAPEAVLTAVDVTADPDLLAEFDALGGGGAVPEATAGAGLWEAESGGVVAELDADIAALESSAAQMRKLGQAAVADSIDLQLIERRAARAAALQHSVASVPAPVAAAGGMSAAQLKKKAVELAQAGRKEEAMALLAKAKALVAQQAAAVDEQLQAVAPTATGTGHWKRDAAAPPNVEAAVEEQLRAVRKSSGPFFALQWLSR